MQLDSGPVKRRATHALRSAVPWMLVGSMGCFKGSIQKTMGNPMETPWKTMETPWKTKKKVHGSPLGTWFSNVLPTFPVKYLQVTQLLCSFWGDS